MGREDSASVKNITNKLPLPDDFLRTQRNAVTFTM